MVSLFTTLLLATQLNVAEAHKARRPHTHARPHRHHTHQRAPRHTHVTHRHHSYNVARPARPPRAQTSHSVYFYQGHWVMTHHRPHLMWRWNHRAGRWVVVFRF
jgi:hypothetical protein